MERLFDEKKATQAAACFLKLADGGLNYMVLIKDLPYLADRQALAGWGRSITNDKYYSMKCGPVLSNVLDQIHTGTAHARGHYVLVEIHFSAVEL